MNLIKKYWLLILLFLIIVGLVFLKIKYSCKGNNCLSEIKNNSEEVEGSKKDLSGVLPYKGKNFVVERYINRDFLEIKINNGISLETAKEEVNKWLEDNGTNSQETQLIYVFDK